MPKYYVEFPVHGKVVATVQADSTEEALEKVQSHEWKAENIEEWDPYRHITEGNVTNVSPHDAYAEEEEGDGEYDIE